MDDEFLGNLVRGIGMATGLGRGWRGNLKRALRGGRGRPAGAVAWHTRAERSEFKRKKMKDQAEKYVTNILEKWQVVIFVSTSCDEAAECKKICEEHHEEPFCVEVDLCYNQKQVEEVLEELSGQKANLRVFVSKKFIGGLEQLLQFRDSGKLQEVEPEETDI